MDSSCWNSASSFVNTNCMARTSSGNSPAIFLAGAAFFSRSGNSSRIVDAVAASFFYFQSVDSRRQAGRDERRAKEDFGKIEKQSAAGVEWDLW